MKYICVVNWEETVPFSGEVDINSSEQIITFPNGISHSVIYDSLKKTHKDLKVISAGFIKKDLKGTLVCHGESSSLKISSRDKIDTYLLSISF